MHDTPDRAKEFFISAGSKTEGPFDVSTLRARVASGEINSGYQVWNENSQSWVPFSTLEPLLRPADPASVARRGAMRSPRASASVEGAAKPVAPGDIPPPPDAMKAAIPRQAPTPISPAFAIGASAFTFQDDDEDDDGDYPALRPMFGPMPGKRQRNYSPPGGGNRANRPFNRPAPPPPPPEPTAEPKPEQKLEPTPESKLEPAAAPQAPAAPVAHKSRSLVTAMAMSMVLCVLTLVALYIGNWISFGRSGHEEIQRLTDELSDARHKLEERNANLRHSASEIQDLHERFFAAQDVVRNLRISVVAATRRSLQAGDRAALDQRLFELERLNQLANESESEAAVRREFTEAFFSGAHAGEAPKPSPEQARPR